MKNLSIAAFALAGLTACDPGVTSEQPLFSAGPEAARPGLWAVLEDGCAEPQTAKVQDWPSCAMPLWVEADSVTYMALGPVRASFVLAEGRPGVAQLAPAMRNGAPPFLGRQMSDADETPVQEYAYMAVEPEGAAPFIRARVWELPCLKAEAPPIAGLQSSEPYESACRVTSAEAVRTLAARTVRDGKGYAAVWVAPA